MHILENMDSEPDCLDALVKAFLNGLGRQNRDARFDRFVNALAPSKLVSQNGVLTGQEMIETWARRESLRERCTSLIVHCSEFDDGLELLRQASESVMFSYTKKKEFERALRAYASTCDNQPELSQVVVPGLTSQDSGLAFIHTLDDQINSGLVEKVVLAMAAPGGPLSQKFQEIDDPFPMSCAEVKQYLHRLLTGAPPSVIEDFQTKLAHSIDVITESAFLHVLVEPCVGSNGENLYQFRAELLGGSSSQPLSFDAGRDPDGPWPKGTLDDFSRIAGQWLQKAKTISRQKLYMEIFVPHQLLLASPELKIDQSFGDQCYKMDLYACGTPVALRSWDRAQRVKKRELGYQLPAKWDRMRKGLARLHPVSEDCQVDRNVLNPHLCRDEMAGMLMLLDLPEEEETRAIFFWIIIDAGIPLCAWWRPQAEVGSPIADANNPEIRRQHLNQSALLDGHAFDGKSDIPVPRGLQSMQAAADHLRSLSGEPACRDWIHQLMLLIDDPGRWPKSILYEQEAGGTLQSPT